MVVFGDTGADPRREFHLNLSKSAGDFSFKGNIEIIAGKGDGTTDENKNAKFVGEFGKKVMGDIIIAYGANNQSKHLSLIHISEPTRLRISSRMPSSA